MVCNNHAHLQSWLVLELLCNFLLTVCMCCNRTAYTCTVVDDEYNEYGIYVVRSVCMKQGICTLLCADNSSALYILLLQALTDGNRCMYAVVCQLRYSIHMFSSTDLFKAVVCTLLCEQRYSIHTTCTCVCSLCETNWCHIQPTPAVTGVLAWLFCKGHGSGCTTALSRMHCHLYRVYCLTPPTSLCSDNTQNLHSSTVERIPKCLHPRPKVNVLATHPTL